MFAHPHNSKMNDQGEIGDTRRPGRRASDRLSCVSAGGVSHAQLSRGEQEAGRGGETPPQTDDNLSRAAVPAPRFVTANIMSRSFQDYNHHGHLVASMAVALLLASTARLPAEVQAVDCFKCSSRNGSNPACEDPFHNLNTTRVTLPILPEPQPNVIYHTPCYAGRKNRDGLFPASACIKLTGVFDTTGETLVVRHCALDSGSLTQDTELARMSHCGKFQFEGDLLRGCVLACPEDACNVAPTTTAPTLALLWLPTALATFLLTAYQHQHQHRQLHSHHHHRQHLRRRSTGAVLF